MRGLCALAQTERGASQPFLSLLTRRAARWAFPGKILAFPDIPPPQVTQKQGFRSDLKENTN